jgi:hypothetical protein
VGHTISDREVNKEIMTGLQISEVIVFVEQYRTCSSEHFDRMRFQRRRKYFLMSKVETKF